MHDSCMSLIQLACTSTHLAIVALRQAQCRVAVVTAGCLWAHDVERFALGAHFLPFDGLPAPRTAPTSTPWATVGTARLFLVLFTRAADEITNAITAAALATAAASAAAAAAAGPAAAAAATTATASATAASAAAAAEATAIIAAAAAAAAATTAAIASGGAMFFLFLATCIADP